MRIKTTFLIGMFLVSALITAQRTVLEGHVVDADEVPGAVLNSQAENFPEGRVTKWKFQKATGVKGNSAERYVAVFKDGKRPLSNARYKADGSLLFFSEYYGPQTIPVLLRSDLSQNFDGFKVTSGAHMKLYTTQKEFYRIRLKKGVQIRYVYYDKQGNQVDRNALPKEADFQ